MFTKASDGYIMEAGLKIEAGETLADLGERITGFSWNDSTTTVAEGEGNYPATYYKDGNNKDYLASNVSVPVYGLKRVDVDINTPEGGTVTGLDNTALESDDATITFTPDDGYEFVDGEEIGAEKYSSWAASTMISLNADYLDSLTTGEHQLAVTFPDDVIARATFKVADPKADGGEDGADEGAGTNPGAANTGESTGAVDGAVATVLSTTMVIAMIGAAIIVTKKKKEA